MPPQSSGGQAFSPAKQTARCFSGPAGTIFSTTTSCFVAKLLRKQER
jgi:hypothetical protein